MNVFVFHLLTISCLLIQGCSEDKPETSNNSVNIVDVTATHDHEENRHLFNLDRNVIDPGWITFQFSNLSDSDHFFMIYKVPDEGIEAARQTTTC